MPQSPVEPVAVEPEELAEEPFEASTEEPVTNAVETTEVAEAEAEPSTDTTSETDDETQA
jgi:hypothetical protein